ncbi:hypothetical protein GGX14DRAFT_479570 [Mycena pura]|uniref:F-box domain-containing protein n=1 Tax=Mycena pura TaxID=153505 RepID=A0AAD6Y3M7_9AGAR|nr:hypothetical protein GGX14DRAFT_479570 [Mycena pura]
MLSTLAADRACKAELETQILALERSIAGTALQLEKTAVQERLNYYKYPVLTLPTEIICEIFIRFIPIYPLCPPFFGPLSPTVLTHICRKWRDIALATSELWRAISLSKIREPFDPRDIWLSASSRLPISISIRGERGDRSCEVQLFAAVLPYHTRWEYLTLHLRGTYILPAIEGEMPLLRHLNLDLEELDEVAVFHGVPLLRTAILKFGAIWGVILPWTQLTSLTLHGRPLETCVEILRRTPNLVHCTLDLAICGHESRIPDVVLPYLESFRCTDEWDNCYIPGCLMAIIVPSLRSLQISEYLIRPDPVDFLDAFISKSGCNLHWQELGILGQRDGHKDSYCKAFPSVRRIFFSGRYEGSSGESSEAESSDV